MRYSFHLPIVIETVDIAQTIFETPKVPLSISTRSPTNFCYVKYFVQPCVTTVAKSTTK